MVGYKYRNTALVHLGNVGILPFVFFAVVCFRDFYNGCICFMQEMGQENGTAKYLFHFYCERLKALRNRQGGVRNYFETLLVV